MSIYYVSGIPYSSDELYHHGIIGQKWGIRRFQNSDGTYTEAGKQRYGAKNDKQAEKLANYQERQRRSSENYYEAVEKNLNNRQMKLEKKKQKATGVNRLMKLSGKIDKTKELRDRKKEMSKKVSKNIGDMSVADMNREKRVKGAYVARNVLLGAGSLAFGALGVGTGLTMVQAGYDAAGLALGFSSRVLGDAGAVMQFATAGMDSNSAVRRDRERRAAKG